MRFKAFGLEGWRKLVGINRSKTRACLSSGLKICTCCFDHYIFAKHMQVGEAMWQIILRNDQKKSELSLKELGWPVLQQNVPRGILAGRVEVQGWNWEGFMIRDSSVQWVRLNFIFSGQRVIKVKRNIRDDGNGFQVSTAIAFKSTSQSIHNPSWRWDGSCEKYAN